MPNHINLEAQEAVMKLNLLRQLGLIESGARGVLQAQTMQVPNADDKRVPENLKDEVQAYHKMVKQNSIDHKATGHDHGHTHGPESTGPKRPMR